MSELQRYDVKSCCRAVSICARVLEAEVPLATSGLASRYTGEVHEVVETVPPKRNREVAEHEASHATVAHALGLRIDHISINDPPYRVQFADNKRNASWRERVIILLAGSLGSNWQKRWLIRPFDEEMLQYIAAVKGSLSGNCDYCWVMSSVSRIVGLEASDEAYLREYRSIEAQTIELIQRPDMTRAVRLLGDKLMADGRLDGATAHALIEQHIPFGSITTEGIKSAPAPVAMGARTNLPEKHQ